MHILVINSGSSSIKFSVFDAGSQDGVPDPRCLYDGELSGIGETGQKIGVRDATGANVDVGQSDRIAQTLEETTRFIFDAVCHLPIERPNAVGYRVVHPGQSLTRINGSQTKCSKTWSRPARSLRSMTLPSSESFVKGWHDFLTFLTMPASTRYFI